MEAKNIINIKSKEFKPMWETPHDRRKLLQFVMDSTGYIPHLGQLKVHDGFCLTRNVACGWQWGKTSLGAQEVIAGAFEPDNEENIGWVVAPTYNLAEKLFSKVKSLFQQKFRHLIVREAHPLHPLYLEIKNPVKGVRSKIIGKSTKEPDSLLAETLKYCVIDECARIKEDIYNTFIRPRLIRKQGWILNLSTPKGQNWFYRIHLKGKKQKDKRIRSWNFPSSENPYLDKIMLAEIISEASEITRRQDYFGEFLKEGGDFFRGIDNCIVEIIFSPDSPPFGVGLDLAKSHDFTSISALDRFGRLVFQKKFNRMPWNRQEDEIMAVQNLLGPASWAGDSTGVGDPIIESLQNKGLNIEGFLFTGTSKLPLFNNLALRIEKGQLQIPKIYESLIEEMRAFEYTITASRNFKIGAPQGYYDDEVSSLALAAYKIPFSGDIDMKNLFRVGGERQMKQPDVIKKVDNINPYETGAINKAWK